MPILESQTPDAAPPSGRRTALPINPYLIVLFFGFLALWFVQNVAATDTRGRDRGIHRGDRERGDETSRLDSASRTRVAKLVREFLSHPPVWRVTEKTGDISKTDGHERIRVTRIRQATILPDGTVDIGELVPAGSLIWVPLSTCEVGDLITFLAGQIVKLPPDHFAQLGKLAAAVLTQDTPLENDEADSVIDPDADSSAEGDAESRADDAAANETAPDVGDTANDDDRPATGPADASDRFYAWVASVPGLRYIVAPLVRSAYVLLHLLGG